MSARTAVALAAAVIASAELVAAVITGSVPGLVAGLVAVASGAVALACRALIWRRRRREAGQ